MQRTILQIPLTPVRGRIIGLNPISDCNVSFRVLELPLTDGVKRLKYLHLSERVLITNARKGK